MNKLEQNIQSLNTLAEEFHIPQERIQTILEETITHILADWNRLLAAGYSREQTRKIMRDLAPLRTIQSWIAHSEEEQP